MDTMGMSMEAQGRYGFFSGAVKASFVERTNYNTTSTFLIAQCLVQNPMTRGHGFKLAPAAKTLLDSNREGSSGPDSGTVSFVVCRQEASSTPSSGLPRRRPRLSASWRQSCRLS